MKITLEKNQKIWFTSDTHYSHQNICRGVSTWSDKSSRTRDFHSLGEMNSALVNGINLYVDENDYLVHLGDWSFGGFESIEQFRSQIKCKNIIIFLGNHDHHIKNNREGIQEIFKEVAFYDILEIRRPRDKETEKYKFFCSHFPVASWEDMGRGVPHLHGHVHLPPNLKVNSGRAMDVGVDGNDLKPYSLDEILGILKGRPIKTLVLPKDHHMEN